MENTMLSEILKKHKMWLAGVEGGERANLRGADLSGANLRGADLSDANLIGANLRGADLRYADLRGANLSDANLRGADLSDANLRGANLRGADLRGANLRGADLSDANLIGANLRGADLRYANLRGANLRGADLRGANLSDANLSDAKYNETTSFFALQCPEKGSFIAYKKCRYGLIVELLIPEDAKRSSATSRKCRASKARVIDITNIENTENFKEAISTHDRNFVYKVGETIEVEDFDMDRWDECSSGVHFFITRQEAVDY